VATCAGSPVYMSPEMHKFQNDKKVNIKFNTDVWSLGIVIYELITLTRPFKNEHEILNNNLPNLKSKSVPLIVFEDMIKE